MRVKILKSELEQIYSNKTINTLNDLTQYMFPPEGENIPIVTQVILDGKKFDYTYSKQVFENNPKNYDSIEFNVQTNRELAFEALDCCPDYIDNITHKLERLVKYYKQGDFESSGPLFVNTIENLDLFIQLIANIHVTLKKSIRRDIRENEIFHNLEIHLLSVLKAILQAKERNDLIMLCDLLESELKDNLTEWKIKAIPELKALKPT